MSRRGRGIGGASGSQAPAAGEPQAPEGGEPTVGDLMRVIAEMGAVIGWQMENRAVAAPVAEARQTPNMVEQFLKLHPPKFDGTGGPEVASFWTEQLEKAFAVLRCTEDDKVMLAEYQLQRTADGWWKATRERVFPEGTARTWAAFCEAFNGKYFSEAGQERKLEEFLRLRQGSMSVDQYEGEFARLSKFAHRILQNPWDKARKFREGLKPELRGQIITSGLRDYNEMYELAQQLERDTMVGSPRRDRDLCQDGTKGISVKGRWRIIEGLCRRFARI